MKIRLKYAFLCSACLSLVAIDYSMADNESLEVVRRHIEPPLSTELVFVNFDLQEITPSVHGVTRQMPAGHSAAGIVAAGLADVVLGSGFVEAFVPPTPLGLLIVNGQTVSSLSDQGFDSIVVVKGQELMILSKEEFSQEEVDGAIQTGPWLIRNGKPTELLSNRLATRSFLCVRQDESVIAGITKSAVTLRDLADYLATSDMACQFATNLAGGGSEALVVREKGETKTFGNPLYRQGSLIGFRSRAHTSGPKMQVLGSISVASTNGPIVSEVPSVGGSVFAELIAQSIAGNADSDNNGNVEAKEFLAFISDRLFEFSKKRFGVGREAIVFRDGIVEQDSIVAFGPDTKYENVVGAIVGVSDYIDARYPDLERGRSDAFKVYEAIRSISNKNTYSVELLIDGEATREQILSTLKKAVSVADGKTLAVFYFSGHGFVNEAGAAHLVVSDSKYGTDETLLTVTEIRDTFENVPGLNILLFDAPFAGEALP